MRKKFKLGMLVKVGKKIKGSMEKDQPRTV